MTDNFVDTPPRITSKEHLNVLLNHMVDLGGSDMFLLGGDQAKVSLHGNKINITSRKIQDKEVIQVISDFYGVNAQSKLFEPSPIDTSYEFYKLIDGVKERFRFRVNAVSCLRGGRQTATVTFREIPTTPLKLSKLNVEPEIVDLCRNMSQGLIVVVGATGSGKSTLLSSILRDRLEAENSSVNLVTIESPIEFVYDDVEREDSLFTQMEIGRNIPSFKDGVRCAMRMAPTHILVGESRDTVTMESSLDAAITGHAVYTTIHANNVPETFQRMVDMLNDKKAIQRVVQACKLVVAQRLLPTVDGKRTAIREYIVLNNEIKSRILLASNLGVEARALLEEFGKPMNVDIEDRFEKGIISESVYESAIASYK